MVAGAQWSSGRGEIHPEAKRTWRGVLRHHPAHSFRIGPAVINDNGRTPGPGRERDRPRPVSERDLSLGNNVHDGASRAQPGDRPCVPYVGRVRV